MTSPGELAAALAALDSMSAEERARAVPGLIDACRSMMSTLGRVRADALREMLAEPMTQAEAARRAGISGQPQVARILREHPAMLCGYPLDFSCGYPYG